VHTAATAPLVEHPQSHAASSGTRVEQIATVGNMNGKCHAWDRNSWFRPHQPVIDASGTSMKAFSPCFSGVSTEIKATGLA
jgi:hypothetical protein